MIYQPNFNTQVKGLFGFNEVQNASLSYKLLEEQCTEDYRSRENGRHPKWNIQEQAGDWPDEIKREHAKIMEESTTRQTTRGRKKVSM